MLLRAPILSIIPVSPPHSEMKYMCWVVIVSCTNPIVKGVRPKRGLKKRIVYCINNYKNKKGSDYICAQFHILIDADSLEGLCNSFNK